MLFIYSNETEQIKAIALFRQARPPSQINNKNKLNPRNNLKLRTLDQQILHHQFAPSLAVALISGEEVQHAHKSIHH
jgi:hypothetical protein